MTGSCNVITLNINRIVQDFFRQMKIKSLDTFQVENITKEQFLNCYRENSKGLLAGLRNYLIDILERVYKYHITFKTMLYELEDKGMFAASNGGYIYINKLYSTIGINGLNEAARFMGLDISNNKEYVKFLQLILGTIKEQNKIHSIQDKKRPFLFNSEVVPKCGGHIKPLLIDLKLLDKDNRGQARETCAA